MARSSTRPDSTDYTRVKVLVAQLCLTLHDPMGCSPPGSSVHGILQAKILEWVAIPFSRASSQSRDQTQVSHIAGGLFTILAIREQKLGTESKSRYHVCTHHHQRGGQTI